MDIEDVDEYHPDSLTPSQRDVLRPRSPIKTRSRSRPMVDDASLIHYALTQLSLKQGIKKFGDKGRDAVKKELRQLHDMTVFDPVDANTLTREQKNEALRLLMFLQQKRDDTVK